MYTSTLTLQMVDASWRSVSLRETSPIQVSVYEWIGLSGCLQDHST